MTLDFLKKHTLFKGTSVALLQNVATRCEHAFFDQGEKIREEDDDRMALYVVQEGQIEVKNDEGNCTFAGPGVYPEHKQGQGPVLTFALHQVLLLEA